MRKYQPIWEELKKQYTASVQAAPELHTRIIKAVTKEKYQDEGYKFILSEKHQSAILDNFSEGEVLTFKLSIVVAGGSL